MGKDRGILRDEMRLLFSDDPGYVKDMNHRQQRLLFSGSFKKLMIFFSNFNRGLLKLLTRSGEHYTVYANSHLLI